MGLIRRFQAPLTAFLVSRLVVAIAFFIGLQLIPVETGGYRSQGTEILILDVLASRWDSGFYISIAEEGYSYPGHPPDLYSSVPFFPLLPLLMRALASLGMDVAWAGILISNIALLLAGILFHHLAELGWGRRVADRAVWYLMVFPSAFFGSAIYTESLFLLLAVAAFLAARRGAWQFAAPAGVLAAMTRGPGLILAPTLLAEWLDQRYSRKADSRPPVWGLLAAASVPLGTLAYSAFLWRKVGDPLAFWNTVGDWGRELRSPTDLVLDLAGALGDGGWRLLLSGQLPLNEIMDLGFALLFLLLGLQLLRQRRWAAAVFVLAGVLLPLSSGLLFSQRRYVWPLFPAYILLAQWGERPWLDRAITALFLGLLGLYSAMFAAWLWVA